MVIDSVVKLQVLYATGLCEKCAKCDCRTIQQTQRLEGSVFLARLSSVSRLCPVSLPTGNWHTRLGTIDFIPSHGCLPRFEMGGSTWVNLSIKCAVPPPSSVAAVPSPDARATADCIPTMTTNSPPYPLLPYPWQLMKIETRCLRALNLES